ncbi:MAG: AMP-binding protein, partial [bacterium]|nr:AMP-binding protein [bacterium]
MKKRTEDTKKYYPLTHAQKRIYYDDKFHPGTSAGTQAFIVRYKRILNISLLQQAINKVIRKNVGFRLRIVEIEHEPKQYVEEYRERNFDYVDFSGTDSEHRMREWVDETVRKPIEILEGDPFYFAILKYNEKESGYYMGFHHAVSDGGSYPIVFSEINEIYHELEVGRSVDDELYPSYLEYISDEQEYLGSAQVEKDKKFWHGTLTPLPQPLNITPKKGDPSDTAGAMYVAAFPDHVRTMMFDYGKAHRASLFKLLLAAISIYAAKISRLDDVTIGAVNHNRAEGNREKVVGMFVSTFPIRQKVDGKMTFNQFLETSGKGVNHILKNHQKYPFDRLATELRDTMGADISYLLDIFISAHGDVEKEGYTFEHIFQGYVPNSLNIHINYNNKNLDGKLEMEYEYRAGHYSEEDAARFHRGLVNVLRNALANPKKEISGIDIVSAEEKKQVLDTFNETESGYPEDKTIHQLFEEQVKKTPASTALIYRENKLTYKVLNEKANQLARLLKKEGVKRYSIVAVMMERSMEMIAVIMAVLKSGGDCLPVDPDLSGDHINYLLEDSKSKLLLTREKDAGKVTVNVKVLPLKDESFSQEETDNLGESDEGVNDPALITYASLLSKESKKSEESQTFKYSKGFKHKLGSLTRSLSVLHNRYSPNSSGTWLLKSLSQHSVSVTEMFLWLFNGGRLVILEKGKETDPERLLEVINNLEITHVHFFPTLFNRFINHLNDQNKTIPSTLKHVFLSGEPLYPVLREKFKALKTEARSIENVYCSKENPVFVSVDSLKDEKDKVDMPKEKPQGNVKVYIINVIDEKAVLLPIGAPGEFCVSGDGLGTYLGEDKTDEFIEFHDAKLYRTGDKARWRPDGSIDFLSDHKNNLINRKGVRIDTAEITECLLRQEEIMETVVVARRRKQEISLTAYFESVKKNIEEKVKKKLSGELPKNMMPDFFVQLEQIPLTPNGSVDHEELLAIPAIDRLLAKIEAEVLHLNEENINLDDNFFKAGGNSFKASQVAAKIHKAFNVKVSMAEIFKRPTLRQLAEYLTESIEVKYLSIQPAEPKEYYPMSSVQKRLYFLHHMEVDEDKTAYNIQMMDIYCKGFDKDKLENAFKALIKRHESLRTSFHIVDGEPVQKIHDYEEVGSNFAIEYYETDENGMIFSKQKGKEWTRVTGLPFQDVVEHFVHPFEFLPQHLVDVVDFFLELLDAPVVLQLLHPFVFVALL